MNIDDITLGEIAEIEDYARLPITDIAEDKPGVMRLRIGLAWVIKRREDPAFTISDAEKLTSAQVTELFNDDEELKK